MKNRTRFTFMLVAALVGLLALTACASTASALETTSCEDCEGTLAGQGRGYGDVARVGADGNTRIDRETLGRVLDETPVGELSEVEAEGILYMREEEKLARDVYLTLYDQWGMQVFSNIASSESTHMDAVKTLIDRYGLEDPVGGREIGEFANEELQALYNQLVAQGSQSLVDALRVGAAIEEIDILDLQEYIAQTDKPDIQMVYENLERGSRNHLRAFVSALERQGVSYEPSYLSPEQFEEIVNSDIERGGPSTGSGRAGQGGRGGQGGQGGQGNGGGGGRSSQGGRGGQGNSDGACS